MARVPKKPYKWMVVPFYGEYVLCCTETAVKEVIAEFAGDMNESEIYVFPLSAAIPFRTREVEISL